MKIIPGALYADRDYLHYYDVTPAGNVPENDYEGPLEVRQRVVKVIEISADRVRVENTHDGKQSTIRLDLFKPQGKSRGFEPVGEGS